MSRTWVGAPRRLNAKSGTPSTVRDTVNPSNMTTRTHGARLSMTSIPSRSTMSSTRTCPASYRADEDHMAEHRTYTIRSNDGDRSEHSSYYPGALPDGSPMLMRAGTHLYALRFTLDGWLREVRARHPQVWSPEH